ncbi:N-acetylmuramoyl-L-alanine amidase [Streptomyces halobius]|uniref:N-acetylmuramoyl-L-alanine amidase n=1 Tax=Streptomyces halobius TaxID=2879846 RepID=A0ABY4MGV7_9ACTN|nr:N-acetylmuramoyl-L-alanine amidase [Streptomyces halobius]UQA95591.1 N-acetylmuramoyl-L-alanine amidase [Streptomyces halobius]
MSDPMSAARFLKALRDEGVEVVEVGNWRRRNRNRKGPWGGVHGVMIHHTVTKGTRDTVRIVRDGYRTLPGPLAHGVITKDGRVHLTGYGRANHAGLGDPDVLSAVIAERALPADNERTTDGNRAFYGFECENLGDGNDPWPKAQLDAIERVSAAICRVHHWGARSVIGHLEWKPGKIDPKGFTMPDMRDRIASRLGQSKPRALPSPSRPKVSLSRLIAAARSNPPAKGQPVTYSGVKTYEAALVDEGLLAKTYLDGHFGTTTLTATTQWQERCGFRGRKPGQPADGIPGWDSLTSLGDKHGFDVID